MCSVSGKMNVPAQKYIYTPLDQLKEGMVANLFGVVAFFKPPYRSKGTDFCSIVTIVDQSNMKLKCTFFNGNPDALPKIFKVGDIVRFHRIKIQNFNSDFQGISSSGFSALVFDGAVGAPIVPRTYSKCYSFTTEDQKNLESLRDWQTGQENLSGSRLKLSDIQPGQYFNLICHLVGKAEVDKASYLLKVWDGTKCASLTWKVCVEDDALEGDRASINRLQSITIDILVYDNHVVVAKSLKVGSCIAIQNIHAKLHNSLSENQAQAAFLEFHLHGGTGYGRSITVLPEDDYDVQELKKALDTAELKENQPLDCLSSLELTTSSDNQLSQKLPPFDALEICQQLSVTVLPAHLQWQITPLTTVINSKAPQKFRIRARLKSFKPQHLYQSVKFHCTKCNSLLDVPDEEELNNIFQEGFNDSPNSNTENTFWYQSATWKTINQGNRAVAIHFVKKHDFLQSPEDSLIMLEGGTFKEICKLSRHFDSIILVRSKKGHLEIDLSTPFLIQGNRWHYGCSKCSNLKPLEMLNSLSQEVDWNATEIAKALGIEPLMHLFVMHFTLEDGTGSLNAYLWKHSKQFFQIHASEILMDSELQKRLHNIMNTLCPPAKQISEYPWMDCCIRSYHSNDGRKDQICYEIFDTILSERNSD
ncbi:protection of telomeres protein 1 [Mixophyes fleayi]|uniref:protection of telomeres protein 1 n=1 Tax=Mixophyes fleayi TaxID=3061075 RepID=UPI003F4D9CC6